MLRCLNGLETYQGGDILIEGQRVDAKDRSIRDLRTRMAMVFQRFNLFPHRTALENVIEGPVYVKGEKPAGLENMASTCFSASVWETAPTIIPASFPVARCSVLRLPVPWP